jgi:hypothetical protein
MATASIGELVAALKEKFPDGLAAVDTLYVARGADLTYRIETREDRLPTSSIVRLAIKIGKLREQIDQRTRRRSP